MANLIHGKQIRQNTLKENLLLVTGTTATNGQILSYDSSNGGFSWVDDLHITGGTYDNGAADITLTDSNGGTVVIDMSTMDLNDTFISGMTFNTGNYNLTIDRNDGTSFTENLGILAGDMWVTGGTYDIGTGIVEFTNNSGGTFEVSGFTSGMTDSYTTTAYTVGNELRFDNNILGVNTYSVDLSSFAVDTFVTGGTIAYVNEAGTTTYTLNDATTFQVTGINDTTITGGTYNNGTGDITLTNNAGGTVVVDMSTMDLNDTYTTGTTLVASTLYFDTTDALSAYTADLSPLLDDTNFYTTGATVIGNTAYFDRTDTLSAFTLDLSSFAADIYVTGGTVSNGSLALAMNDDSTVNVTGTIIQSVSGNSPITASTTNGAVTVGIDYSALQLAVPTTGNKQMEPTPSTGNTSNTGLTLASTPANNGYVKVEVNGVGYTVGDGVTTEDSYFSRDDGATAESIADLIVGDTLIWNGDFVSFELDDADRIDFFYNILQ